jgi:hypothetical protein
MRRPHIRRHQGPFVTASIEVTVDRLTVRDLRTLGMCSGIALTAHAQSMEANLDDPLKQAKVKAAATYDTAADHFDDEPLALSR